MIADPQNDFERLENSIAGQLQAQTEFQNLQNPDGSKWEVLCEDQGDIEFMFTQMINACGFSIVVNAPVGSATDKYANIPGPVFDPIQCFVQVSEAVIFNRQEGGTKIHVETGASIVRRSLHLFTPTGIDGAKVPLRFVRVEKDRIPHPETGQLVASRFLTFETRIIEQSKTIH